jgi:hypothetical protein
VRITDGAIEVDAGKYEHCQNDACNDGVYQGALPLEYGAFGGHSDFRALPMLLPLSVRGDFASQPRRRRNAGLRERIVNITPAWSYLKSAFATALSTIPPDPRATRSTRATNPHCFKDFKSWKPI